ncbi:WXG100 family type VII secretion target [Microbacterium sp. gxy059]|uniref:WXG100 family type VII secretion target n=1 Tax=Microbacterium sp. gxy059 TaxID=2957199 RepID=UPI003D97B0A5
MEAAAVPPLLRIEGEPDAIDDAATDFGDVAEAIVDLARRLRDAAEGEYAIGKAADQFRDDARTAAGDVDAVAPRYAGTGEALAGYARELDDAQRRADEAIERIRETQDELWPLYDDRTEALRDPDADDDALDDLRRRIESREDDLDGLLAAYEQAIDDHDAAGHAAADLIEPILGALDDGWWAQVGDFFSSIGDWLLDAFEQLVMWVSDLIVAALALVAILVVVIIGVLVVPIGDIDLNHLVDRGIALTMGLLGALHGVLVPAIWFEIGGETPRMNLTEVWHGAADPAHRYRDLFESIRQLDRDGGTDSTRVEIVHVGVDEHGNDIWRVLPPSTQDWELLFDTPAANDLGSNLALMLAPDETAAYERMVIDAMEQAGIGPDDPVMIDGFSQSGILAGRMAEAGDYNVQAIVVAGAPIDAMDIPSDVSVISIQHVGDPVHRLDGTAPADPSENHVTVHVNPPGEGDAVLDAGRHNSGLYGETIQQIQDGAHPGVDDSVQDAIDRIMADQDLFFSDDETHYVFEGSE